VFDHFTVIYEYADGTRAFHTCRQIDGCPSDNTDYIYGTTGSCTVNGWTPTYVIRDLDGKQTWKFDGKITDMYQNEHDELFASIRAGKPINDGAQGAKSTLLAIMGRMAAYTGQTVTWEQALESKESIVPAQLAWDMTPPAPIVPIPGKNKLV